MDRRLIFTIGQRAIFAAAGFKQTVEKIGTLNALLQPGNLRSVLGRRFSFDQMVEAHRSVQTGHKVGNAIIASAYKDMEMNIQPEIGSGKAYQDYGVAP